jgi:hypothetical protein
MTGLCTESSLKRSHPVLSKALGAVKRPCLFDQDASPDAVMVELLQHVSPSFSMVMVYSGLMNHQNPIPSPSQSIPYDLSLP